MNVIGKAEIGALVDKLATYFNVSEPTWLDSGLTGIGLLGLCFRQCG
jgi:hypothetical protein